MFVESGLILWREGNMHLFCFFKGGRAGVVMDIEESWFTGSYFS